MSAGKVVNLKVTVVNHSKKYRKRSLVYSIILLVLGIFLTFNSSGVLNTIFNILGILVVLFGIYRFFTYYRLKSQLKIDDSGMLMSAVMSIVFGVLIILLSNILTSAIQVITGIWLLFVGISRLGETDLTKLSQEDKSKLVDIANSAASVLGLSVSYDASSKTLSVYKDGELIESTTITSSEELVQTGMTNYVYIAILAVVVIAIAAVVIKRARANA